MAETKEMRLSNVHERAIRRFDDIQTALRDERLQCIEDRRFYSIAGAQWEGPLGQDFANVPRFEINKIHLSVIRIFNEYRNNRISVDFRPKDRDQGLADTLDGLYRADEQDSGAQEAYDNAFEEAVGGGFGAWRLRACYEDELDEDDDRQRIKIEPIFDADSSVYFDLDAKRQDKADSKYGFIVTGLTRESYEATYNDDVSSWPKDIPWQVFDWVTMDVVYIAEYYEVEETSELCHYFRGLDGEEIKVPHSEMEEKEEILLATGFREVRQKRIKKQKVHKYLMNGNQVLEDQGFIAGSNIPIIPVYGKRWYVNNVERCMGHVRLSKDAQRLLNMQISRLGQIAALSPIEKPIFAPEQMAGHTEMWAQDNIKQFPFMLANLITGPDGNPVPAGPIGYTKPPSIPPAMAAIYQFLQVEMNGLLGNQEAAEKLQSNVSAKAVELVQNRLDMQTFIYMDNMAKAMKRCGEVWLGMAKELYVEEGREMKAIDERGTSSTVELQRPAYQNGEEVLENDLSKAKMDVIVDVGPSFTSRRDATVRALTGMMNLTAGDPQMTAILAATALMNMDGEGIKDVQDYFRAKLVRQGVVKPTEEEAEQLQAEAANAQPDPQAQYLQAASEEATAKAGKARADTVLTVAKAEQARAETVKTLAEVGTERQKQVMEIVDRVTTVDRKN